MKSSKRIFAVPLPKPQHERLKHKKSAKGKSNLLVNARPNSSKLNVYAKSN